ncbi:hypothetical protein CDV31_006680 [Fusarium ambrosium]|uniref:gamma-glutamylcyclotransferase n=1 Tax=Fusarium ambrosium TaxID=131363 RepID=A0A428UBD1_9HYPO|nr:hypothetical protein CDV31_006680 [Fusarium ambrosium]
MSEHEQEHGAASAVSDAATKTCVLASLCKVSAAQRPAPEPTLAPKYPSVSSIPRTSAERLAQAAEDVVDDPDHPKPNTYLYLAYGSNMCAQTFLGMRGIRPLSQVNVSVPTLELKFDLPGIPYREPCFANVGYRKMPDKPKLPPKIPFDPPQPPHSESKWDEGLLGVVYEVTEEDYKTIIRTEGGGTGYKQIMVPCLPLPPKISIPEKPFPEIPKPFLAKTLFAPQIPDSDLPDDPHKKKWWYRFLIHPVREPGYAQPSLRYLNLIRDGAKEHDLPEGYQRWLNAMPTYTITNWRQRIGAVVYLIISLVFFAIMALSGPLADKEGKLPRWLALATTVFFNISWMEYDGILKPVFGDGERTEKTEQHWGHKKKPSWSQVRQRIPHLDEEKVGLLKEFE